MANQKLTPRQKMINMMYLVLIAMLALNVSREILKSFHLFELSFNSANNGADQRNNEIMDRFKLSMYNERSKIRAEKWYIRAKEARNISAEFCQYLEQMKSDIVKGAGGREEAKTNEKSLTELKRPDDIENHAHYFIPEGLGNGPKLQKRINETRSKLIQLLTGVRNGKSIMNSLEQTSNLKALDPKNTTKEKQTWVSLYLENAPLAGVVALLTKTQNDCKTLESEILSVMEENININTLVHDGQMAMIIPENQSVMSGEKFKARVALISYDTRTSAKMLVNGQPVQVRDGFGHIEIPAVGTGSHTLKASIESIDPNTGQPIMVESGRLEWNSFTAAATVSADNMNVLFIGLDNPMSISVPGITPENTIVTSNNGISLKNMGHGKYTATVKPGNKTGTVTVKAKLSDGSIKQMGEVSYKIRSVPSPKIKMGNLEPGTHSKSALAAQTFLFAVLEDFYFNNVSYKVTSFKATLIPKKKLGYDEKYNSGNSLNGVSQLLKNAGSGDVLYIDEIKVKGPSGDLNMGSVTYKIK